MLGLNRQQCSNERNKRTLYILNLAIQSSNIYLKSNMEITDIFGLVLRASGM